MIACFVQARYSSRRLPGKVMKEILGKPMLELQIERLRHARRIDKIIVVTSVSEDDDRIAAFCADRSIECFRGSLENVLDRFYQAAKKYRPDHIIRVTGDCPLIDPAVVDGMVGLYLDSKADYGTNCVPPTFPDGLDAEIFPFKVLEKAKSEAVLPSHIEHISPYFEDQPSLFKIVNFSSKNNYSDLRWTVDEPDDLELVRKIFESLYPSKPSFSMSDILSLLAGHPEWSSINSRFTRNEGLARSKEQDKIFLSGEANKKAGAG